MRRSLFRCVVIAAVCMTSAASAAAFELRLPSSLFVVSPYVEDGYVFTNSQTFDASSAYINESAAGWQAGPDPTIGVNYGHTTNVITRADGGLFDVNSIGFADIENAGLGGTVDITLDRPGLAPQTSQIDLVVGDRGLQDFAVDGIGVQSFSFASDSIYAIQFGDLQLGIPEPATWMMMIVGVALVGASQRRRRPGGALKPVRSPAERETTA